MENELKIVVEKGVETITVLHGQAEPVYHQKAITVKGGAINSVVEYLTKNVVKPEVIEHSKVEFSFIGNGKVCWKKNFVWFQD